MFEHFIFIFYIIIFIFSTIGYGLFFSSLVGSNFRYLSLGYQGLFGFFFLSLISTTTTFFVSHGYIHNILIHLFGIYLVIHNSKYIRPNELKTLAILVSVLIIGAYIYKNHDDFPYYHLTYALTLAENKYILGLGNLGHGFRTNSSLFFFHSLLFLPIIKHYLFHIGPFLILIFFNLIIIKNLFIKLFSKIYDVGFFFCLYILTFVNIALYRLSEHGTDRSAQILVFLVFYLILDIFNSRINFKLKKNKIEVLLVLIFFISTLKSLYYIYLFILPILFFKFLFKKKFFKEINKKILSVLIYCFVINLLINFLNTGCLIYPAKQTCFKTSWSIPNQEVKIMNIHYEWWAKGGGGPNYKHEMDKVDYISNFNWVANWIDRHFFNKVSDTLFGIIFISLFYFLIFKFISLKKNNNKKKNYFLVHTTIIFLLFEWFLKHPAMRYGGYVLFALPFFLFFSNSLSKYNFKQKNIKKVTFFSVFLIMSIFIIRNIDRLHYEISNYGYNLRNSPYFNVLKFEEKINFEKDKFIIYSSGKNMCWASKTPCTHRKGLEAFKMYNFDVIYKNNN